MANPIKRQHNASEEMLYTVCELAWSKVKELLPQFSDFKPRYTTAFVDDALAAVAAAKNFENMVVRNAVRKAARSVLLGEKRLVLKNRKKLKRYAATTAAFAGMVEEKLQSAGATFYYKASKHNWPAVSSLIKSAKDFIEENKPALMANNNMPARFVDAFIVNLDECDKLLKAFLKTSVKVGVETVEKTEANNTIYEALTTMMADAQALLDEVAYRRIFVFSYLRKVAEGRSPACLKGNVTDENNRPLKGAVIQVQNEQYKATSNKSGYYKIGRLLAAEYVVTVRLDGYEPVEQIISFHAGKAKTVKFRLMKIGG